MGKEDDRPKCGCGMGRRDPLTPALVPRRAPALPLSLSRAPSTLLSGNLTPQEHEGAKGSAAGVTQAVSLPLLASGSSNSGLRLEWGSSSRAADGGHEDGLAPRSSPAPARAARLCDRAPPAP